jgi:VacB/RNase II family 3'-5' exoribonuclease
MSKAEYSTENIGHYGLAFEYYTHFTSPIRRYPDVMVHRLLEFYLNGAKSRKQKVIEEACKHCSKMEAVATSAERESIKYMQIKYMESLDQDEFLGVISGVTEWGMYVEIIENKCEGMVRIKDIPGDLYTFDPLHYSMIGVNTKKTYQLGDEVTVSIKQTNLEKRQMDFNLIQASDR